MFGSKRLKLILTTVIASAVMVSHVLAEENYYKIMGVSKDAS